MVSFIIPAFNASKTIKRAINSILNQNVQDLDFEIIIVDDGSDDDSGSYDDSSYDDGSYDDSYDESEE